MYSLLSQSVRSIQASGSVLLYLSLVISFRFYKETVNIKKKNLVKLFLESEIVGKKLIVEEFSSEILDMKRSRKSNTVSWAPGFNLCQVRLFLSEDCPSKVGGRGQDHLQKNPSSQLLHSNVKEQNDLPPGFEVNNCVNVQKKERSGIRRIQWKCPPKVLVNSNWHVAVGEESQEIEAQKLREMRVLEAVYPRPSAVPSCPCVSMDVEDETHDDSLTPIIPLIPVEEEEAADMPSDFSEPVKTSITCQLPALPRVFSSPGTLNSSRCNTHRPKSEEPASAAVTAIMKTKEQGNLIDICLLQKILSYPKMIEELISGNQAPPVTSMPITSSILASQPKPEPALVSAPFHANGNIRHLFAEKHFGSRSMNQIPLSIRKPAIHLPSMYFSGSLHHSPSELPPAVTRTSMHPQDTAPATGLGLTSSGPVHIPESGKVSVPRTAGGNLFSATNPVRTAFGSVPPELKSVQGSFQDIKPNFITNMVMKPIQSDSSPAGMKINPVKDFDYIKNLIKEHGTEKKSTPYDGYQFNGMKEPELVENIKKRELKPKFQKHCMYFKTQKGCRNGSNCPFQHDSSLQFSTGSALEVSVSKRMKFGELTGRG